MRRHCKDSPCNLYILDDAIVVAVVDDYIVRAWDDRAGFRGDSPYWRAEDAA